MYSGSDSEEELFYYTSKKVPVDDACGITQAFTNLQASSPPQRHFTASDHDYLVKVGHFARLVSLVIWLTVRAAYELKLSLVELAAVYLL